MIKLSQFILIVSTLLSSWFAMQAVHEFGHVVGARLSGAQVTRVVLHPLTTSRTEVGLNPHQLIVVWCGPAIEVSLPVVCWGIVSRLRFSWAFLVRFFAGFCCLANGLYIGIGSFGAIGDCSDMLRHGSSIWQLWLFGAIAALSDLLLGNGQGQNFGLEKNQR